MTISKILFAIAALIFFLIGLDVWNPHSDIDWPLVSLGLVATGLCLEGFFSEFWHIGHPHV